MGWIGTKRAIGGLLSLRARVLRVNRLVTVGLNVTHGRGRPRGLSLSLCFQRLGRAGAGAGAARWLTLVAWPSERLRELETLASCRLFDDRWNLRLGGAEAWACR